MNTDTNTEKQDYEIARDELNAAFAKLALPFTRVVPAGVAVKDKNNWKHNAYLVLIGNQHFVWKQGLGIKTQPNPAEVLARYCADYVEAQQSFPDWCSNFGYSDDSIDALEIYRASGKEGGKLSALLTRDQIHRFAELSSRL